MSEQPKTPTASLLVGQKPAMNYVLYMVNQMKDEKEISVKARGLSISKAVDVVEILRRRFIQNLTIGDIKFGTDEVEDEKSHQKRRISTIEIIIKK